MKNDKRYSLKDVVFILWFMVALSQIHLGLFVWFGITNPVGFLILHGVLMGIEGLFAALIMYDW